MASEKPSVSDMSIPARLDPIKVCFSSKNCQSKHSNFCIFLMSYIFIIFNLIVPNVCHVPHSNCARMRQGCCL